MRDRLSGADGLAGNRYRGQPAADLPEGPLLQGRKWLPGFTAECLASPTAVGRGQGRLHRAEGLGQDPRAQDRPTAHP